MKRPTTARSKRTSSNDTKKQETTKVRRVKDSKQEVTGVLDEVTVNDASVYESIVADLERQGHGLQHEVVVTREDASSALPDAATVNEDVLLEQSINTGLLTVAITIDTRTSNM